MGLGRGEKKIREQLRIKTCVELWGMKERHSRFRSLPGCSLLGTLRNSYVDGNWNKKKTTLPAFLYISLPSLQQLRREMTNFELTGERERQGDTFCSLWTRTRSPLFSSHLTSLLSSNWVTWYKGEKVSKFHRRFHWRCRCRIVRSYFFTEGGKGNASKEIGDVCTQPTGTLPVPLDKGNMDSGN